MQPETLQTYAGKDVQYGMVFKKVANKGIQGSLGNPSFREQRDKTAGVVERLYCL